MQKIALINDSFVGTSFSTMNTNTPVFVKLYTNEDSIKSFDSSGYSNEDDDNSSQLELSLNTTGQSVGQEKKEVKKRQRLTNLTPEEKILRRKLKNRMAAQSARDRKKLRMEELEQELIELKTQNEKLKSENQILKDNTKLLIEENRKLLKFKTDTINQLNAQKEKESKQQNSNLIQQEEEQQQTKVNESNLLGPRLKRKLNAISLVDAGDESAVFFKFVSQPQKQQLQLMFQKFICVLILYTMNLISKETNTLNQRKMNFQQQLKQEQLDVVQFDYYQQELKQQRSLAMKISKLKVTLLNLLKLLKYYRQRADTQSMMKTTALIKCNPVLKSCLNQTSVEMTNKLNTCKLMIFVSLMMNLMKNKH